MSHKEQTTTMDYFNNRALSLIFATISDSTDIDMINDTVKLYESFDKMRSTLCMSNHSIFNEVLRSDKIKNIKIFEDIYIQVGGKEFLLEALRASGYARGSLSAHRSIETLQYALDLCLQVGGKGFLSELLCEENHGIFRNAACLHEGIDKCKLIIDFYGKADSSIRNALLSIKGHFYRKENLTGLFEEHKLLPLTFENHEIYDVSDNESLDYEDSDDEPSIFIQPPSRR